MPVVLIPHAHLADALALPMQARASLAVALLTSLNGPEGMALMFAVMAKVDAHANEIYRSEFEKEC